MKVYLVMPEQKVQHQHSLQFNQKKVFFAFTYKNSSEFVQHPVLRRRDALQMLLRSSSLDRKGHSRSTTQIFTIPQIYDVK